MPENALPKLRWYQGLTRYHWWVLFVAVLSWTFDCMDQRIFVLSRAPAVKELIRWEERRGPLEAALAPEIRAEVERDAAAGMVGAGDAAAETGRRLESRLAAVYAKQCDQFGDVLTALMILGWAVGGFFFGVYGDKWGRVKTLAIAISVYSVFTGLSGLAAGLADFSLYRFLMGCGIGGAFATAASLVAETMPEHSRAFALGLFQALSAVGNLTGSAIARFLVSPEVPTTLWGLLGGEGVSGWRVLFMIGVLPAMLVVLIFRTVKEPDAWHAARKTAAENLDRQLGDIKGLFTTPRWRRNTLVGLSLALVGVIGLWGVGFYTPELIDSALGELPREELGNIKSMGMLLQDVGAFFGMLAFTWIATRMGRRLAFGGAFVCCWVVVSAVFLFLDERWHAYAMLPFLGFVTLSLFGGYSIYFPEIYPTRLRSTGTGFCYNVGRVVAALFILFKIPIRNLFDGMGFEQPFRSVSLVLALVYLAGLIVLFWAPETKGRPLPTDD
ncbi:MAG TPA: MFS transporter [Planctomycetes bacterium]|nr:MFS transporter [Planctomycetota bacterium]